MSIPYSCIISPNEIVGVMPRYTRPGREPWEISDPGQRPKELDYQHRWVKGLRIAQVPFDWWVSRAKQMARKQRTPVVICETLLSPSRELSIVSRRIVDPNGVARKVDRPRPVLMHVTVEIMSNHGDNLTPEELLYQIALWSASFYGHQLNQQLTQVLG